MVKIDHIWHKVHQLGQTLQTLLITFTECAIFTMGQTCTSTRGKNLKSMKTDRHTHTHTHTRKGFKKAGITEALWNELPGADLHG